MSDEPRRIQHFLLTIQVASPQDARFVSLHGVYLDLANAKALEDDRSSALRPQASRACVLDL